MIEILSKYGNGYCSTYGSILYIDTSTSPIELEAPSHASIIPYVSKADLMS